MNKLLYFPLATVFFMASCDATTEEQAETSTTTTTTTEVESVVNVIETEGPTKVVAHLAIEGMGCAMACGGAIKKALGNMDGVVTAEIDFDGDKETNFAIVEYDESKVSGEQMIEAVSALRKGQYTVSGLTIEKHVKAGQPGAQDLSPSSGKDAATPKDANIQMRSIALPNLFDILNRF